MRKNWKRWIAGLLTAVMLVTMLPTVAYAAVGDLLDMSGVQRTALLAAREEVYGDDAEPYLAILKQYGLIDEDGREILPIVYSELSSPAPGYIQASDEEGVHLLKLDGTEIWSYRE